jgi:hypothetical protein
MMRPNNTEGRDDPRITSHFYYPTSEAEGYGLRLDGRL